MLRLSERDFGDRERLDVVPLMVALASEGAEGDFEVFMHCDLVQLEVDELGSAALIR